jgi:hypothetical protein
MNNLFSSTSGFTSGMKFDRERRSSLKGYEDAIRRYPGWVRLGITLDQSSWPSRSSISARKVG